MSDDTLQYSMREFNGIRVVEISGNLSVNTNTIFEKLMNKLTDKESVIVNMEHVTMLTSSGIESLVEVSQTAREKDNRVVLLWASDDIKNLSESLSVYNLLIFADSLEEGATKIKYYT